MAYRANETYHSIREQLERDTQGIIPDRSPVRVQPPSAQYVQTNRQAEPQGRASYPIAHQKKTDLKNKIRQIIELCKDQNSVVTKDIAGMAEAERGIFNLLKHTDVEAPTAPGQPGYGPTAAQSTPIRSLPEDTGKNLQRDIRSIIERNGHVHLSEEALQLINEIEKRSLAEIEKIRDQKLALINQLNDQIRRHNNEKRRSAELEREADYLRKGQGAQRGQGGDRKYENQLKSKVAYLENVLRQTQNQPGFKEDLQDFQALFAQGEAIRQQTLRLLRLKQSKGHSDDSEKRRLREEVQHLQRKVQQLQGGRVSRPIKQSYETINEEYSPISVSRKQNASYRNSGNEYESLVTEMRKITAN